MLDKIKLGEEIKNLRKSKKLTQDQLANGICNQSEISRIEDGKVFPSIEILYLISNKLEIPITSFFEVLSQQELEKINIIKSEIWSLSQKKNFEELDLLLDKYLSAKILYPPEMRKFLLWKKVIVRYALKKYDADYCLAEMHSLLRKPMLSPDRELNLHIKNSIANILAEKGNFKDSYKLYKDILRDSINTKEADKIKIKTLYNYGKLLFLRKEFDSALEITGKGINLALVNSDLTLLGHLYYQKGSSMEELDYLKKDIIDSYTKSLFFFDLLNLDIYKDILLEKKSEFFK